MALAIVFVQKWAFDEGKRFVTQCKRHNLALIVSRQQPFVAKSYDRDQGLVSGGFVTLCDKKLLMWQMTKTKRDVLRLWKLCDKIFSFVTNPVLGDKNNGFVRYFRHFVTKNKFYPRSKDRQNHARFVQPFYLMFCHFFYDSLKLISDASVFVVQPKIIY